MAREARQTSGAGSSDLDQVCSTFARPLDSTCPHAIMAPSSRGKAHGGGRGNNRGRGRGRGSGGTAGGGRGKDRTRYHTSLDPEKPASLIEDGDEEDEEEIEEGEYYPHTGFCWRKTLRHPGKRRQLL